MAHGRPIICSEGAGAVDVVNSKSRIPTCNVEALAEKIDGMRRTDKDLTALGLWNRELAKMHTWDKIRGWYVALWEELLV